MAWPHTCADCMTWDTGSSAWPVPGQVLGGAGSSWADGKLCAVGAGAPVLPSSVSTAGWASSLHPPPQTHFRLPTGATPEAASQRAGRAPWLLLQGGRWLSPRPVTGSRQGCPYLWLQERAAPRCGQPLADASVAGPFTCHPGDSAVLFLLLPGPCPVPRAHHSLDVSSGVCELGGRAVTRGDSPGSGASGLGGRY